MIIDIEAEIEAMNTLIAEHALSMDDFHYASGEEDYTVDTKKGIIVPPRGCPIRVSKESYEYDEWEHTVPTEDLEEVLFWQDQGNVDSYVNFMLGK